MGATHSSSHGRQFGIGIVGRSDLDDIRCDKVDALQTADNSTELASGPASSLRSARSRRNYSPSSVMLAVTNNFLTHKQDQEYQYLY